MKELSRIDTEGIVHAVRGGEQLVPHDAGTFPADAEFVGFDPETLTVTYRTQTGEDDEGNPVYTEDTRTFTEEDVEDAKNPPPAPVPVPESLSQREFRLALIDTGISESQIVTQLEKLEEPARSKAKIDFDRAARIERSYPLVTQIASAFGLSDAEVDDLFRNAVTNYRGQPAV